ncbi:MAG: hypothetical protein M1520_00080 [Candidatus Marsarchaeota archaeon]|nr:hypothetical protein [Candidatus Marsarchaeota archaeon]
MAEDVTFLDLACLMKISDDTTLERFGSAINASIFDASNIAGTLKQKDLIDFTSIFPGPNSIAVTENGKTVLREADQRSATPFDNLDKSILTQISNGRSSPKDIQSSISLNSRDLAMRLYKLSKQSLLTYELKSGNVEILLTEQGFLKASPQQQPMQPMRAMQTQTSFQMPQPQVPDADSQQQADQQVPNQTAQPSAPQEIHLHGKPMNKKIIAAAVAIIIIIAVAYLLSMKII